MHLRSLLGFVASLVILTGCPHRFDSRADPIPSATDPVVEREYRDARARFEAGDHAEAAARYAAFVAQHPTDPLVRSAKIGEARARLELGQTDKAKELLEPLARAAEGADPNQDPVAARARNLLGAMLVRGGEYARGRELLQRFRGLPATADDEIELHALFANAALGAADWVEALAELDRWYPHARPAEQRYIVVRTAEAATKLPPADLDRVWRAPHETLITAFVGPRVSDARRQAGDAAGATQLDADVKRAREKLDLEPKRRGVAEPRGLRSAVGCVLPLSGKARALGERALRGALLGAELLGAGGQGVLSLEVRDSGSDPARARAAAEELAQAGVLAIVGPPDRAGALESAAAAIAAGVPIFGMGADDGRGSPTSFRLARPRAEVARVAVRLMVEDRIQRVAILGPDGASAKELARVFGEAARASGLTLVAEIRFAETATSFGREMKQLEGARPQAVFVPATAAQLDLLAPQLASAGLVAMANLRPSGKEVRLFAAADGLSPKSLVRSGKYLQGATLFPPFWADPNDPRALAFLERYHEAYGGEDPSVLDALSFDAVRAIRLVVSQQGEPQTWADVASGLRQLDAGGLTGRLGFGADGQRSGEVSAWVVDGAGLRPRAPK